MNDPVGFLRPTHGKVEQGLVKNTKRRQPVSVLSAVTRLLRVTEERAPGPPSSYTQAHFLLAILEIGDSPNVGRQLLARRVGLGEGATRTLLRKLREGGLIKVTKEGCSLTEKGRRTYRSAKRALPGLVSLGSTELTVGSRQTAVLARGVSRSVKRGIEQRDAAIKAGAAGATTYVISGSKFQIPAGSKDCEKDFPHGVWNRLREELEPRDRDVVIMCGSSDELTSKIGAISAALTLLR